MSSDNYVHFARGKAFEYAPYIFDTAQSADILNVAWQVFESFFKSVVMLQRQNGGRHKHSHLFAVGGSLERRPNGYLGFSETNITAYKAIHRFR